MIKCRYLILNFNNPFFKFEVNLKINAFNLKLQN